MRSWRKSPRGPRAARRRGARPKAPRQASPARARSRRRRRRSSRSSSRRSRTPACRSSGASASSRGRWRAGRSRTSSARWPRTSRPARPSPRRWRSSRGVFDHLYVNMVHAGEAGGALDRDPQPPRRVPREGRRPHPEDPLRDDLPDHRDRLRDGRDDLHHGVRRSEVRGGVPEPRRQAARDHAGPDHDLALPRRQVVGDRASASSSSIVVFVLRPPHAERAAHLRPDEAQAVDLRPDHRGHAGRAVRAHARHAVVERRRAPRVARHRRRRRRQRGLRRRASGRSRTPSAKASRWRARWARPGSSTTSS